MYAGKRPFILTLALLLAWGNALSEEEGPDISWLIDNKSSGPFLNHINRFVTANDEKPFTPEDSTSAAKIKGEYRMNIGYQWADTEDFYWKYANTEMIGHTWRYLYGEKRYKIDPDSSTDRSSIQPDVLDRQDIIRVTYVGNSNKDNYLDKNQC